MYVEGKYVLWAELIFGAFLVSWRRSVFTFFRLRWLFASLTLSD